jgi:pimeloyl-ACP methyl ester carboxylesterase
MTNTIVTTSATGGNGPRHADFAGSSGDGATVYFETDESMLSADTDTNFDVYKRTGGVTTLASDGPAGTDPNQDVYMLDPCVMKSMRWGVTLANGKPLPADRWTIAAPVAVAVGSEGEEFIRVGAAALADLLPNVTVLTLEGHDHSAFWMAPQPVAEQIRAFLLG